MTAMVTTNAHDLVRLLESIPELDAYRVELIDGKIVMLPSAAPFHNFIRLNVGSQFLQHDWYGMVEQALVSPEASFEPKPDIAVTTHELGADNLSPFPAERVAITVEIVSTDRDGDYAKKRLWYAISGIPLYVVIDPDDGIWELHSGARGGDYRTVQHGRFGEPIELPEPFAFPLDTSAFKVYPPTPPR
ncbi:Uma2 family endonuclease [Kitasatospora sp. GP30]|uniref:Uma2 family endonuclease n=1 Tax=Kitasatospora sp. GP30 TaxID=3035084 RepID=UPI000C700A63|nr:Uma2 family endonuclease [Kitasatospora sp. GP30]MDH6140786.1 Uma2 family endonuclease [Kitasatospora sp. GP30]